MENEKEVELTEEQETECANALDKTEKLRALMSEVEHEITNMTMEEFLIYYLVVEAGHSAVVERKYKEIKREQEEKENAKN